MSSSPAVVDVASGAGGGAGAGEPSRSAPGLPQPDAGVIATLSKAIRVVPDYPKPGVTFKDYTPMLKDSASFRLCINTLAERYRDSGVTAIVSCEARGLVLGSALAFAMGVAFVPLRKPMKLPCATLSVEYGKGFTKNRLEAHDDALTADSRVVIFDDVIASGKTMVAAVELVDKFGATLVECVALADMPELHGLRRLQGTPLFVLLPDV